MNLFIGQGRLTKDVELTYSESKPDMAIARYTIAVECGYGQKKETSFVPIVAFGKAGEFASKYFHKGERVLVAGQLQVKYDKEKQKTYVSVIANNQEFADSKKTSEDNLMDGFVGQTDSQEDELPFT